MRNGCRIRLGKPRKKLSRSDAVKRPVFVTDSLREARLQVCEACPFYVVQKNKKLSDLNQCSVCKCFMEAKAWLKSAECPENRWSDIR
jgi:hypothetical protein